MRLAPLCLLLAIGCAAPAEQMDPKRPPRPAARSKVDPAAVRALSSARLADVPAGTFGPYFADTKAGGLALWAAQVEGKRQWSGRVFDDAGEPAGAVRSFGAAPEEIGLAVAEPKGSTPKDGFLVLYTRRDGERTLIEARNIDQPDKPAGEVQSLGEATDDVLWIDAVVTRSGAIALWAVRTDAGADVLAKLIGDSAPGHVVATGARAWQAATFGDGAALGFVSAPSKGGAGGRVEVVTLDASGKQARSVVISDLPTAEAALDMVSANRGLLFAWSDRGEVDARVMIAAADAALNVVGRPTSVSVGLGEQALVRLVPPHASGGPAYLALESLVDRPRTGRTISISKVSSVGKVSEAWVELFHASEESVPELTATRQGLAALALAPACRGEQPCDAAPQLPTFIEIDRELSVKGSAPVRMTALGGEAPDLAWGLSCPKASCRLLAAQLSVPAPVYVVKLAASEGGWQPAARRPEVPSPPRAASLQVVAAGDPLAGVSMARVGDKTLAAWVTYFDPTTPWKRLTKPAADGRFDPPRAQLQLRELSTSKPLSTPTVTLSIRARSTGGVALAPGAKEPGEALLVWTALDYQQPQVFATVVDGSGKKLRQRMLTRARGEKTDVAAAGVGEGWVMAWIDERHGDPELYAARMNRLMQSAGPDKRITKSAGVAADVTLLERGGDAWVAWSDARDASRPGWADIYVAKLKGADASLIGTEQIVAKTPLHSRSPSLAAHGKGTVVAWIEESPVAAGGSGEAEVKVVALDEDARPAGSSTAVRPHAGTPTAVSVDCAADRCHVVMAVKVGDRAELEAFEWSGSKASEPKRLASLTGSDAAAVGPVLLGRELLFSDRAGDEGRVRRLWIDWK